MTTIELKRIFQTLSNCKDKFYVYALCDKTKLPFYIGKGTGERVLQHQQEAKAKENIIMEIVKDGGNTPKDISDKIKKIIQEKDNVECVIIKYGLTEHEALMCESSLINMINYSNNTLLKNIVNGHASEAEKLNKAIVKTQARTLPQFLEQCAIESKDISEIPAKVVCIKINALYEQCLDKNGDIDLNKVKDSVRAMWSISNDRKKQLQYVFALYQQRAVGIFHIKEISDSVNIEYAKNKLINFPKFPVQCRKMDTWKARFSTINQAKKELNNDEFNEFFTELTEECKRSQKKTKKTIDERLKDEQRKVFFILDDNIPEEILCFKNCLIESKQKNFNARRTILYNF